MNYNIMRIIVMYDITSDNALDNQAYNYYRKLLLKNGYIMMQYSVYSKCINSKTKFSAEIKKISQKIPKKSRIRVLFVTEKQYGDMVHLSGKPKINEEVNGTERYICIED
ncbi:MAG: CRISPR-associated endonuclease Cas2 [Mycoplasmoidaceae bacterium]